MKRLRATLIALVICAASIGFGLYGSFEAATQDNSGRQTQAAACARCGDGVCAKSCENATTCPRDCGGGGGGTSAR
jgi:hypothetical protein